MGLRVLAPEPHVLLSLAEIGANRTHRILLVIAALAIYVLFCAALTMEGLLQVTGSAAAYRSAFAKLAKVNKADPHPHPLEVFLLHDHPPLAARLALADQPPAGN